MNFSIAVRADLAHGSAITARVASRGGHTVCKTLFGGINIKDQTATLASPASQWPKAVPVDPTTSPPRHGLPLGALLGVTISVLVALLLGALTAIQLHRDESRELKARESLLAESLVPLAEQVEEATNFGEITQCLSSHRLAEISRGRPDYNVVLRSADGRVRASAGSSVSESPRGNLLHATMRVRPKALPTGTGTLIVWQDAFVFELQIPTIEMHRSAEEAKAAHWRYRAGKSR